MKINNIQFRNIGSYGNKIHSIDFTDTGLLYQLSGRSGMGKSTILNLPKLAFFGKIDKVNKNDIANRINKNGWVRIDVDNGDNNYIIERTFSPSSLKVFKNGNDLEKAGIKDAQQIIDNEIVEMPYNIFSNVITISLNDFKSFISMTPNDKRQIIDKIFSLEIVNQIHDMIKKDLRDISNGIALSKSQILTLENQIKQSKIELDKLEKESSDDIKQAEIDLNEKLNSNKILLNDWLKKKTELDEKKLQVSNGLKLLEKQKSSFEHEIKEINKKIDLFKSDKCPLCETVFNTAEFDNVRKNLNDLLISKKNEIENVLKNISKFKDFETKINQGLTTVSNTINSFNVNNISIQNELNKLNKLAAEKTEFKSIQNIISTSNDNMKKIESDVEEKSIRISYLEILENLYSNDGIKKKMMSNYLPLLNEEIKNTLISLSFPYNLEFDNNFDPHLFQLGEEIPTDTLSTGERKKVDVAVICSIIKMLKRKYPQINLLCLDETLSSLDYDSCVDIIKFLQQIAQEMQMNIFIVSHNLLPLDAFDVKIDINKNNGFSDFVVNYLN